MKKNFDLPDSHRVPRLAEVLLKGDSARIEEIFSGVKNGEVIEVWGMILEIDQPNELELPLLKRSKRERRELGLISVGETHEVLEGKSYELDERAVLGTAQRLSDGAGPKYFSHTHWDQKRVPTPSSQDLAVFRNLKDGFGYDCRVLSWLPDNKVFIFRGDKRY